MRNGCHIVLNTYHDHGRTHLCMMKLKCLLVNGTTCFLASEFYLWVTIGRTAMLLPKVRYSIAYRFTGSLSKGMTAHAITDYSHKQVVLWHINDLVSIFVIMPSTSLAYCCISYLHITIIFSL